MNLTILIFSITFQEGDFLYENSTDNLAIFISIVAVVLTSLGVRFQILSMLKNQLANKAAECNKNINQETHAIIENTQNISHVVSLIITGELLVNRVFKSSRFFFPFGYGKQSLMDQFYFQLHTSIVEYIIKNQITSTFKEDRVKYHITLQLNYCHKLFKKSTEKYGNATPKEIQDKLKDYKDV